MTRRAGYGKARHPNSNRGNWARAGVIERLGTVPDSVIAKEVGVTHQRIAQVREKLGIAAYAPPPPPAELLELLGHQPDTELAERFCVSLHTVRQLRLERDIPKHRAPCGTPARYNAGCRCDDCKEANAIRRRNYMAAHPGIVEKHINKQRERAKNGPHDPGTIGLYGLGCRCDGCRAAMRTYYTPEAVEARRMRREAKELRVQARVAAITATA